MLTIEYRFVFIEGPSLIKMKDFSVTIGTQHLPNKKK